jgi:DNA-binding MarR family transcriptional regulator
MTSTVRNKALDKAAVQSTSPAGCSSEKLRSLSRRVSRHFDHIVGVAGLKTTQYSLLSNIVRLGKVRPGELADLLKMEASTLTRNLQPLVAQGWVVVGPGDDGRTRFVSATDSGREKSDEAKREWKRAQLAFNARLTDERVMRLHALIDECLAAMNETSRD